MGEGRAAGKHQAGIGALTGACLNAVRMRDGPRRASGANPALSMAARSTNVDATKTYLSASRNTVTLWLPPALRSSAVARMMP